MDITKEDWPNALQPMLMALSNAHFVSFDLEMAGLASKVPWSKELETSQRQTLQQRYEDTKAAAEKYQVLQIGFTIIREDVERGIYIARPYNMNLSPLLTEKLGIDREFAFKSSNVEWLINNTGFSIEGPFMNGLPYLSREEEKAALEEQKRTLDPRSSIPDIHLTEDEVDDIKFVQDIRKKVRCWLKLEKRPDFLNLKPPSDEVDTNDYLGFGNRQRRLIHQLIRAEHPGLLSKPLAGFIQIQVLDPEREEKILKARLERLYERLGRQIGIRWFVEGMVGGSLKRIDPLLFVPNVDGRPMWYDKKKVEEDFAALRHRVTKHRTVLVGHNLFTDLIYFYRTFFGTLPSNICEFKTRIHELFPMVIDTKYLATHFNKQDSNESRLEHLDGQMSKQSEPVIECHNYHQKYKNDRPAHEAGYDAYVTAKLLIRLSAKLEAVGYYMDHEEPITGHESSTRKREREVAQSKHKQGSQSHKSSRRSSQTTEGDRKVSPGNSSSPEHLIYIEDADKPSVAAVKVPKIPPRSIKREAATAKDTKDTSQPLGSKASDSLWELISGNSAVNGSGHVGSDNGDKSHGSDRSSSTCERAPTHKVKKNSRKMRGTFVDLQPTIPGIRQQLTIPTLMPHFENDFWRIYGNKLRVFGIEGEQICDLND